MSASERRTGLGASCGAGEWTRSEGGTRRSQEPSDSVEEAGNATHTELALLILFKKLAMVTAEVACPRGVAGRGRVSFRGRGSGGDVSPAGRLGEPPQLRSAHSTDSLAMDEGRHSQETARQSRLDSSAINNGRGGERMRQESAVVGDERRETGRGAGWPRVESASAFN